MTHLDPTGRVLYDADTGELIEAPAELVVRWPDGRERVLRLRVARGEVEDAGHVPTGTPTTDSIPTEPDGTE